MSVLCTLYSVFCLTTITLLKPRCIWQVFLDKFNLLVYKIIFWQFFPWKVSLFKNWRACFWTRRPVKEKLQVAKLVHVDGATRKTWQGIQVQVASNNIRPAPHEHVLLDKFSFTDFICSFIMVYPLEQIKQLYVKENLSSKTCACGTGFTMFCWHQYKLKSNAFKFTDGLHRHKIIPVSHCFNCSCNYVRFSENYANQSVFFL